MAKERTTFHALRSSRQSMMELCEVSSEVRSSRSLDWAKQAEKARGIG